MKRAWIVLAALAAIALGLAVGLWLYRGTVERDLADIEARLVSEGQLSNPSDAATASAI